MKRNSLFVYVEYQLQTSHNMYVALEIIKIYCDRDVISLRFLAKKIYEIS